MRSMTWLNEPPEWTQVAGRLHVVTGERTDFWQETFYGFNRDDGHFYHRPVEGDFTAEVTFDGAYEALYDQAGLMLRLDGTHWLKAGIEFTDGVKHFSVVVTNGRSDWSVVEAPWALGPVTARLTRHGDAVRVQFRDAGGAWRMARLALLAGARREPGRRDVLLTAAQGVPGELHRLPGRPADRPRSPRGDLTLDHGWDGAEARASAPSNLGNPEGPSYLGLTGARCASGSRRRSPW